MKPMNSITKAIAVVAMVGGVAGAGAHPVEGTTLFYTTFAGGTNVWRSSFSYDGSGLAAGVSYGAPTAIAATFGADGLVFNPNNGHLLVGGQGPRIHDVPVSGAPIVSQATDPVAVFHLAIDPGLAFVYGSGIPGAVAKVGISAGGFTGTVTPLGVVGSTTALTSLAFDTSGGAFYTNASPGGPGQFGTATIGPAVISTTSTQFLTAAHGMIFDPSTGWLTLFGDDQIAQIDPASPGVLVASMTLAGVDFDQGTSDGAGHLWVASNNGNVTFIDLNSCTGGKVDAADCFIDTRFLISNLDDLAPLSGLGGCGTRCLNVPEPGATWLVLLGAGGLVWARRRKFG